MRSTPLLIEATPRDGYIVHPRFEDGTSADVDLSYLTEYRGVFEPVRDLGYFRRLRVDPELGTIVWPNDATSRPRRCTHALSATRPLLRRFEAPQAADSTLERRCLHLLRA